MRIEEYNKNHENTFSLEILPSGDYAMEYGNLLIKNHSVFIGVMGDISEDEYVQHEYFANQQANYIYGTAAGNAGTKSYQSEGLACAYDPLSSQDCDGYAAAFLTQQCESDSFYSTECDGYQDAYDDLQCDLDPLYSDTCDGYYETLIEEQLEEMMEEEEEWMTDEETGAMYGIIEDDEEFTGIAEDDEFFTGLPEEFFMEDEGIDLFASSDIEPILIGEQDFLTMSIDELPEIIEEEFRTDALEAIEENVEEVEEYLQELFDEETEELFEELFEEELLEELETLEDVLEEEIVEEEFEEVIIEEDPIEETSETVNEPKTSPLATRIALAQTKNALKISASAVTMSQESSKGDSDSSQQAEEQQNQESGQGATGGSGSTVNQITQSAQNQQNTAQSMGNSSVMGVSNQFFSADTQIFSNLSGVSVETLENNAEMNEMKMDLQVEQMQMEIENNLISSGTPVTGVTIIPVEVMTVQPEQEAPRKSLAEVISEKVAQQKMESSNKVASGQTAAIASLQNSVDLGSYYESNLTDGDFYNVNYIVYDNKLDDNARLIYNLSKSNHGTIRKMIRSQYE